jgi:hypothetical protein
LLPFIYGQSQKETSSEDEQAQAPEALEVEPAQEAHVAEISRTLPAILPFKARRITRRAFIFGAIAGSGCCEETATGFS